MKLNDSKFAIVAIGASAGGPSALESVLSRFPVTLPVAIVLSQHMPDGFTKALAQRLADVSDLKVREACDGWVLRMGDALIAPGGHNIEISDGGRVRVQKAEQVGPSPSIDIMMKSVAEAYGARSIGVLLTGMLTDGVEGMKAIKNCGGVTIVQDEASCVVYGMPKAALEAGAADIVAHISEIPERIANAVTKMLNGEPRD